MRRILLLSLVSLTQASPSPQYSGQTTDLSDDTLDTFQDIFGEQTGKLNDNVEVIVQIVKNEDGYVAPDDYVQSADQTKATTSVDNVFENCADYTESQGYECVPYYQCDDGVIITDGGGLIDIRNGFGILSPEDSKCEGFLDVCCLDPDFTAPPPLPVVKHIPQCGRRHENGLGVRIQGYTDQESQFGEWPHMCAVLQETSASQEPGYTGESQPVNLYKCGGSLIAPGVILTGAHCVAEFLQKPQELKIRCGEWDTQNQTEPRPHQDRYVSGLDIHPEFNSRNLANDWALLYTQEPFELQAHIDTVCLPQPGELFEGQTCFATGWGKDQFGSAGQYQVVMKEVDLQVVSHQQCWDTLKTTRLGNRFKLDDSFICADGLGNKDTCKGDGGGPLVCSSKFDPNTYVQAGIVAWGIGCGDDVPGVYASVSEGVCWLDYAMTCQFGSTSGDFSSYWGYSANQCQDWMDRQVTSLNQRVVAMQDDSLKGIKRRLALDAGTKAQKALDQYNQCTVFWEPVDAQPLTTGGEGYTEQEGEVVDVSNFERDSSYTDPLTDGSYTDPLTDGSYTEPLTDGSYTDPKGSEPLTDGSYTEPKTADQSSNNYDLLDNTKAGDASYPSEPLTDGTDGNYGDGTEDLVKVVDGSYTEDTAAQIVEAKSPGPVY